MEVTRCPRCNQQLLPDEATCWQCGYQIREDIEGKGGEESAVENPGLPTPVIVYGLLTVCVIVAALLVTASLGRQPRVQAARVPLQEGWQVVADDAQTFTVYLPETWTLYEASDAQEERTIGQLLSGAPEYRMATEPLTGYVEDEEVLFLAQGSDAPGSGSGSGSGLGAFLIVVRSAALNGLTPVEAIGLARETEDLVTEAEQVTDFERNYVALRVEYDDEQGSELHCRQQFTTGEQFALLLSFCSTPGRFREDAANTIMQSAQRLAP
jgi:hypothetical protein